MILEVILQSFTGIQYFITFFHHSVSDTTYTEFQRTSRCSNTGVTSFFSTTYYLATSNAEKLFMNDIEYKKGAMSSLRNVMNFTFDIPKQFRRKTEPECEYHARYAI